MASTYKERGRMIFVMSYAALIGDAMTVNGSN